jgi:hypothetical protein
MNSPSDFELPANLWTLAAAGAKGTAALVDRCIAESLLPILFAANLPDVDLTPWRALRAANRHRVGTMERNIAALPALIGEDFLVIKGADYGWRLYPSPELRPMGDIDILVPRERFGDVIRRVTAAGHAHHSSRLVDRSASNPDYAFDLGDVTLEVHQAIVHRSRAKIDEHAIWADRVPHSVAGIDTWRASDVDALLISVMNIAKEDLATPLIRYLDLWLMLRRDPALFAAGRRRARSWRMVNAFDAVMRATSSMFPDLRLDLARRPLFDRFAFSLDRRRSRRMALLWRKYWLIDGIDQRLAYLASMGAAAASALLRRERMSSTLSS